MTLNEQAARLADALAGDASALRIQVHNVAGARVADCGIRAPGGLRAGLEMARICLAGRGEVRLVPGTLPGLVGPQVQVNSDDPVTACLASQYAGWRVKAGKFFGMGSGPMRAAYGKEAIFDHIPGREKPPVAVGVIETGQLPTEEAVAYLTERLALPAESLTVLCAPAASLAGTVQVVARALETALHKLHELKFDLTTVISGYGVAPLPPVARDDIEAIGRPNDAILYGGQVVLWVNGDDAQLAELGPKVPSSASADHGAPFAELFERYNRDFYKIDPLLFSPAVITFNNLATGRCRTFGRLEPDVLRRSFGV
jgi:methenyltetrahydromethanopterin cyclohydrolase